MNVKCAQDKDKEIAFFDAHAESDEYDVFTLQTNERLIAAFVRLSGLAHGARVADLGCGSGVFTELLRRRGAWASTLARNWLLWAGGSILDSG